MLFALQIDPEEWRVLVASETDPCFTARATLEEVQATTWLEAALRLGGLATKLQTRIHRCEKWLGCSLLEAEATGKVNFLAGGAQTAEDCCAAIERRMKATKQV